MTGGVLETDTIAAVATAAGRGALAVIRLSGSAAIPICDSVFRGKRSLAETPSRTAVVGEIVGRDGAAVDQVVALVMRAPETATGEDVVEITCHGGLLVPRLVLRAVVEAGARPASADEFTKRGFLNGKIDLAQAEAVEAIVRATSDRALRAALRQLRGEVSREMQALERSLLEWLARIEATIDFVEDEVEALDREGLTRALAVIEARLADLLAAHDQGRCLREGVSVVIVGKPNAGKSSLFNRLVGQNRVIVSDLPGTTRDVIDGLAAVDGLVLALRDTAGIRRAQDRLEAEAVARTRQAIADAEISLVVLDSSTGLTPEDCEILAETEQKPRVIAANKADLPAAVAPDLFWAQVGAALGATGPAGEVEPAGGVRQPGPGVPEPAGAGERPGEAASAGGPARGCHVSALTGAGMDKLAEALGKAARGIVSEPGDEIVVNERHAACLRDALAAARRARASLETEIPLEFTASDVRNALDCLGEVTGRRVSSDLLVEIFSRFCIGK